MATITLKGQAIHTIGELPRVGTKAPPFKLAGKDLVDVELNAFRGKRKILNIVASLETSVCATSAMRFNKDVSERSNVVLINISADLPFAQSRFCESHNLKNIVTLSTMRAASFGKDYGVVITDGPMAGLMSRAVVVLDENDIVVHAEQVPEIGQEPDYAAALQALS